MKIITHEIFLVYSLFTTLLMGWISYLGHKQTRIKPYLHVMVLAVGLALNAVTFFYFLKSANPKLMAFAMVGWVFTLKGFSNLLEDLCGGPRPFEKWRLVLLVFGGVLSMGAGYYNVPFTWYTAPFALSTSIVGLSTLIESIRRTSNGTRTPIQELIFGFTAAFFLLCVLFPFWGSTLALRDLGLLSQLLITVGLAVCCVSGVVEFHQKLKEHQMEMVMKERNDKLLSNSKYSELGMMSAGIAHEINNPLAVIQARTTQLLRIYKNPKKQQDLADGLQQILYTSERINRTIQGVREFIHQDEKGPAAEVRIKDLVDDVLAFCGQRLKNHGVNLRLYGIEKYSVWGNKIQMEQILLNLINNSFDAIEFLPDKWIEISVHHKNDKVQLYVKDSGHGISPEIATRMMDPFYTTKDVGKGTGLGLALARGIAEKHGGELSYLDHCNHTTFLLELPQTPVMDWGLH